MTAALLDCVTCGACCSHKWSWPILRRDRSDARGIPAHFQRTDYPLLVTDDCGRCAALQGTVGHAVSCSIYDVRPDACRNFQPGATLCLEARTAKNLN